jgi:hypothetical protein
MTPDDHEEVPSPRPGGPRHAPAATQSTGNPGRGLHGPRAGLPADLEASRRFTPRKVAVQLVGFSISLALLGWVIARSLDEESAQAWERLREADAWAVAIVVGATAGNIAVNGLIFHAIARPVRRMSPAYLIAVNALATLLATLPFKLGVLIRGLIHHRRDGMAFKEIVGWFTAVGGLGVATLVPIALLSLWRTSADAVWFVGAALTLVGTVGASVMLSRLAAPRDSAFSRLLARASLGSWRFLRHPSASIGHAVWRTIDIALLAARFYFTAQILGFELGPEQALILGTTFFLISVSAPSGNLGIREAATVAIAKAASIEGSIAPLAIIVSFAELLTALAMSAPALAIVRPDRLLRRDPAG